MNYHATSQPLIRPVDVDIDVWDRAKPDDKRRLIQISKQRQQDRQAAAKKDQMEWRLA